MFSFQYWLNTRPGSLGADAIYALIVVLAVLLAVSAMSALLKRNRRGLYFKVWQGLANFGLANFIIGLFLLFFSYEAVPFLSARFWLLLWLVGAIVWLAFIFKRLMKIPQIKKQIEQDKEYKKYLPK